MNTRLAVPADATTLARMRYAFRAELDTPVEPEAAFVERCADWMRERLGDSPRWRCWVVEDSGVARGQLWLQLIEKLPNPGPELEWHAYVTNVYVEPEARGRGAGEMLVAAALTFCREVGIDSVILWPTAGSRTLYARHGFTIPSDMMEAILDSGRDGHP